MPRLSHSLAAALILSAQTAWADVTPEQVWQSWQDAAKAQGQTITAKDTKRDGDTLTVTGVTLTMNSDTGKGSASLDKIGFQDKGDGTVAIILPDSYPVQLVLPPAKDSTEGAKDLTLTVLMPGAKLIASGVPLSVSYETDLPRLDLALETSDGEAGAKSTVSLLAKLTGVTGHYLIEGAEAGQNMTEDFAIKTLNMTAKITGDGADEKADFALTLADLGGKVALTGVPTSGMEDFDAALNAGMAMDFSLTYGAGSMDLTGTDGGKPIKFAGTNGSGGFSMAFDASKLHMDAKNTALALKVAGTDKADNSDFALAGSMADFASALDIAGASWTDTKDFAAALKAGLKMSGMLALGATTFDFTGGQNQATKVKLALDSANTEFAMDSTQMHYNFDTKAVSTTVSSPDIPMPEIAANVDQVAFAFQMPIAKSDTPAPFTYLTKIEGLTLPDALWAMVDPNAALPHGPTSLVIDTKGMATITRDLTEDATALESGSDAPPGLLNALNLTQLHLTALGAEVQAAGAFTFDNSDMTTFEGVPLPTGKIDIKATGVNALIDTLVAMGLIPKEEAMQGRMAMAMFANTSTTADEITSTLEFKDKHFFANGVQMQ